MTEKIARFIQNIFHPLIFPTLGFILLLNSGLYDNLLSIQAKRYILLVVFFVTATLPMLTSALLTLNQKFEVQEQKSNGFALLLLFTSIYYYIGYILLSRIHFLPMFKLFMIASVIVIVVLMIISFKWEISLHMAAAGATTAVFFAISFRHGVNPLVALVVLVVAAGLIGTARLILNKNNLLQLATGYLIGFFIVYPVIYFL